MGKARERNLTIVHYNFWLYFVFFFREYVSVSSYLSNSDSAFGHSIAHHLANTRTNVPSFAVFYYSLFANVFKCSGRRWLTRASSIPWALIGWHSARIRRLRTAPFVDKAPETREVYWPVRTPRQNLSPPECVPDKVFDKFDGPDLDN